MMRSVLMPAFDGRVLGQGAVERSFAVEDGLLGIEILRELQVVVVDVLVFGADVLAFRPAALQRLVIFFVERLMPILAHGMAFEAFPHQDAAQVGMVRELDAVQVPDLALLEFGAGPNGCDRWNLNRVYARNLNLEDDARAAGGLVGVVDDFHLVGKIIHAGDGGKKSKPNSSRRAVATSTSLSLSTIQPE